MMQPRLCLILAVLCAGLAIWPRGAAAQPAESAPVVGNRLAYLEESDPFYVHLNFPKLVTPQWVGETGVEAVVILSIDDMKETQKYEAFLRPLLERLKRIDGRAPVSILCNALSPTDAPLQAWLKEGLSLEVHTLSHPCPLLAKGNFAAAADTYHGGVDLLNQVPGNRPVAFRMPCCDSMNSPSPRFYAEILNRTNSAGRFLTIDSSVMNITTPKDKALPRDWVLEADGRERFRKYLATETNATTRISMRSFVTTIEDYPYPYVIGRLCWEFPAMVPSDWEAHNLHGSTNPVTVADWKTALDVVVVKQGIFNCIFHPHGWIRSEQVVEFIDYAVRKYGKRIKFLTFREAQERIDKNLLMNLPLRAANGQDNGVRLLDLNNDGYLDVVLGNAQISRTRLWQPQQNQWVETSFPTLLMATDREGQILETGVKFGGIRPDGHASLLVLNEGTKQAWHFDGARWIEDNSLLEGLEIDGQPVFTSIAGRDRGVRLRDVDNDKSCELIVGNEKQNAIFTWLASAKAWKKLAYSLPEGTSIVNARGQDKGLRFIDLNQDGFDDVIFSNEDAFSIHLFVGRSVPNLRWETGWTRKVRSGKRGDADAIPMIVRGDPNRNNGAWCHSRHLWVQNEDTAHLPDKVDRRSFGQLVAFDAPPPKSPEESLKTIQVRPGFKVELVAQEPLVQDPVAFEWGADGKLWVVEMGDYPVGVDGHGERGGLIRFLEDTDQDGRYDKSTIFLSKLNFPTGVIPWRKGVLVSAAPEIFYAEDTDGDGKADLRQTLFTGFVEGNQQHRVNGFDYGLDNWVYGANGDSGGKIRVVATGKTVDIRGHDFRFRPDENLFEPIEGITQFGRHRDDWGNWFGNNNPTWLWHYWLPERYLARNPHLPVRSTKHYLADYPNSTRVHPLSRPMQRFNWPDLVNTLTSANSATPYRDELFGADYARSIFISEPAYNLVHREVLASNGATFTSRRAPDEQKCEFLASSDNWFRPTMLKTGPDGALYISDMYRLVIEHPEYALPGMENQIELRAGADKGRIYRVYPEKAALRKVPRLDQLDATGLVAALNSASGWQRDTAQRLLVHSGDKSAVLLLRKLVAKGNQPKARLQALCTLEGLGALTVEMVLRGLGDPYPAVREQAVHLSEAFFQTGRARVPSSPDLLHATNRPTHQPRFDGVSPSQQDVLAETLLRLVDDPDVRVRYQLALSLGEWTDLRAGPALAKLASKEAGNTQFQTAVMSSAPRHVGAMLSAVLHDDPLAQSTLIEQLLGLATAMKNDQALIEGLNEVSKTAQGRYASWQYAALAGFLDAFARRNGSLEEFQAEARPELKTALLQLDDLFSSARQVALNPQASESERVLATRLLGHQKREQEQDLERLGGLLYPQHPASIQKMALTVLSHLRAPRVAEILIADWPQCGPTLRAEVVNVLFTRPEWTERFLKAIETNIIAAGQLTVAQQQKLLTHSQEAVRMRAAKVFAAANVNRNQVLKEYQQVGSLAGNPENGAPLFHQHCASCHRFKNEGTNLGPDLAGLTDKSVQTLLVAVLNPNQAVEPAFVSYSVVTKGGRELSGIIVAETANSITLRGAGGSEETILRPDLQELTSSGLSMMPEGLEKTLRPQEMADLLAYILK